MIKTKNSFQRITRILFGLAVLICLSTAAQAATFTVTSNANSGGGTLRQAILDSNTSAGVFDTINFMGVTTIALTTPLPAVTDPVMIDGGTSPANGGTSPAVELNGLGTQGCAPAGCSIGLFIRAGGTTVRGMIINRFGEAGIRMDTDGVGDDNGNTLRANRIGTNTTGDSTTCGLVSCGNINRGILIVGTTGHNIGVTGLGDSNLISGNQGRGIEITAGGSASIRNNLIGTDIGGTIDLGNLSHGIQIVNSSGSTIGGTSALNVDRNIISGNNGSGIFIVGDVGTPASNNTILGNFIGVTAFGNTALPNSGSGVVIQDANNTVGGTTVAARNVISGNSVNGVSISTTLATGNTVSGNYIGVGADGTTSLPNVNDGVRISSQAANNTIGGTTGITAGACTGSCNLIANNGVVTSQSARAGIYIDNTGGTGNAIRANSIFNNFGLGIDLGAPGATANDTNDPDIGPNDLQNKPVLTTANTNEFISGTLNSTAGTTFAIDFFVNSPPDTLSTSEGRTYIGTINCMSVSTPSCTISGNNYMFNFATTVPLSVGQFVTATATATGTARAPQAVGDSSEHSDAVAVVAAPPTAAAVSISGQVKRADGVGLRAVSVSLFATTSGETFYTTTNQRGVYQFDDIPVGQDYIVTVQAIGYTFNPSTRFFSLTEELTDVDFIAARNKKLR